MNDFMMNIDLHTGSTYTRVHRQVKVRREDKEITQAYELREAMKSNKNVEKQSEEGYEESKAEIDVAAFTCL